MQGEHGAVHGMMYRSSMAAPGASEAGTSQGARFLGLGE